MNKIWYLLLLLGVCMGCGDKNAADTTDDDGWLTDYEERFYNPHRSEFIDWMKGHPESLDMDLSDRAEQAEVKIYTSSDGNLRVYTWISGGGTSPDWTNITQYRDSKGKVRVFDGMPLEYIGGGGTITDIIDCGVLNGEKVYFLDFYSKASSQEGYNDLYAAVLKADTFALGPTFYRDGETSECVGLGYSISDWYFRTNGEGWDQMFHYDREKQQLYVVQTDEKMSITGKYDSFVYDKQHNVFRYAGESGSPFVHASIRKSDYVVNVFETSHHLGRLDRIDDSYRLALWSNPAFAKQTNQPDLIISDGKYEETAKRYVFKVDNHMTYIYEDTAFVHLKLYYKGKLMYHEKERDYRESAVDWTKALLDDETEVLSGSEVMKLVLTTEHYIVQVDSTSTGEYRYASWKHFPFWSGFGEPDIVLTGGKKQIIDDETYYVFRNGKYIYQVPTDVSNRLKVSLDGVKICEDMVWGVFTPESLVEEDI